METPAPLGDGGNATTGTNCLNCGKVLTKKRKYCSAKCGNDYRVDQSYFGGKRDTTIGLLEKTCQVCKRKNIKGLSSHHVIGKENDLDNLYLVALCRGCHQLITILGRRNFNSAIWESLIRYSVLRKASQMLDLTCTVTLSNENELPLD